MVHVIRAKVDEGGHGSDSAVIRDAMRGWLERDRPRTALDAAIAPGLADAEAGPVQGSAGFDADLLGRRNGAGDAPRREGRMDGERA